MRISLELFFAIVRINRWVRRRRGLRHGIPLRMVALRRLLPRGYLFTVLGIAVGVAGLVALGAMAERITRFIDGGDRFVLGQISVAGEGMGMGAGFTAGGLLRASKIAQIGRVPGVAAVQAQVMLPLNPDHVAVPDPDPGADPGRGSGGAPCPIATTASCRSAPAAPFGRAIAGWWWSAPTSRPRAGWRSGGTIDLATGSDVPVVGVLDKTLTAPDRFAIVPLEDARDLWLRRDPLLVQVFAGGAGGLGRGDLNTGAAVGWADGVDPDALARRIQAEVPGLNVTIPGELSRLLRQSTAFFSALLFGIGVLGLVIGGLSLSNTVTAAVFERIRDFGIKRALGRHRRAAPARGPGRGPRGVEPLGRLRRGGLSPSQSGTLVDARAPRRPAALPVLAAPARLLRFVFSVVLGGLAADLRHAPHRAALARRGHPARGVSRALGSGRPRATGSPRSSAVPTARPVPRAPRRGPRGQAGPSSWR